MAGRRNPAAYTRRRQATYAHIEAEHHDAHKALAAKVGEIVRDAKAAADAGTKEPDRLAGGS